MMNHMIHHMIHHFQPGSAGYIIIVHDHLAYVYQL